MAAQACLIILILIGVQLHGQLVIRFFDGSLRMGPLKASLPGGTEFLLVDSFVT